MQIGKKTRMVGLLAALLLLVLTNTNSFSAEAFTVEGIIQTIDDYAYSQNTKNATLAASLFAEDGNATIPAGTFGTTVVGRGNILKLYQGVFSQFGPVRLTAVSPTIVNGFTAAVFKALSTTVGKCLVQVEVAGWFTFTGSRYGDLPYISSFTVLYNTTNFDEQANCGSNKSLH